MHELGGDDEHAARHVHFREEASFYSPRSFADDEGAESPSMRGAFRTLAAGTVLDDEGAEDDGGAAEDSEDDGHAGSGADLDNDDSESSDSDSDSGSGSGSASESEEDLSPEPDGASRARVSSGGGDEASGSDGEHEGVPLQRKESDTAVDDVGSRRRRRQRRRARRGVPSTKVSRRERREARAAHYGAGDSTDGSERAGGATADGLVMQRGALEGDGADDAARSGAAAGVAPKSALVRSAAQQVDAWRQIEQLQRDELAQRASGDDGAAAALKPIKHTEALRMYCQRDFTAVLPTILTEYPPANCCATLLRRLRLGPPALRESLEKQRRVLFCLAKLQLDFSDVTSVRVLQSVYMKLTGNQGFAPQLGSHWESIGFQSDDPRRDLRGAGMLGLLQLLYLLGRYPELAADLYKLSVDSVQNFPLCVVSLNITRIALETVRDARLNAVANKLGDFTGVLQDYYVAVFLDWFTHWRRGRLTVRDFGTTIRVIEERARKQTDAIIKQFLEFVNRRTAASGVGVGVAASGAHGADEVGGGGGGSASGRDATLEQVQAQAAARATTAAAAPAGSASSSAAARAHATD